MSVCSALCVALGSLAAGLLAIAVWLWNSRLRTSTPGPPTIPLLGNALLFYKLPVLLDHIGNLCKRYGDIFRFYLGPKLFIVVTRPEDAQRLLAGARLRDRGPYVMRPLRCFIGNGLITSSGDTWKTHRRIIEPCFHSDVLKRFSDDFNGCARYVCERLAASAGSQVDVYEPLCLAAMRTLSSSLFGVPFHEMEPDTDKQDEIAIAFISALKLIQKRIFRPWLQFEWMMFISPEFRLLKKHVNILKNLVVRGIAYKRCNGNSVASHKRRALMDTLMESDVQVTDEEIYDEACTFLLAGTETTASSMGYALALLALHPEWQDAVHQELDTVFGTGDDYLRPSTNDDLARLSITESVIKETLRLYPMVPNAPVFVTADTPLAGGRHVAPRGSYVLVALHLLHRLPEFFPDPEKFDPTRFLHDKGAPKHPYSYLPFGAGSRKCVGARFAMLEIKTVLAAVLRRFRVLPGSTRQQLDDVVLSITGQPLNGLKVTCVSREVQSSCQAK